MKKADDVQVIVGFKKREPKYLTRQLHCDETGMHVYIGGYVKVVYWNGDFVREDILHGIR